MNSNVNPFICCETKKCIKEHEEKTNDTQTQYKRYLFVPIPTKVFHISSMLHEYNVCVAMIGS